MNFIFLLWFSISFVVINEWLGLGDEGIYVISTFEFHFDLQQTNRKQFKRVSSCIAFVSSSWLPTFAACLCSPSTSTCSRGLRSWLCGLTLLHQALWCFSVEIVSKNWLKGRFQWRYFNEATANKISMRDDHFRFKNCMIRLRVRGLQNRDNSLNVSA